MLVYIYIYIYILCMCVYIYIYMSYLYIHRWVDGPHLPQPREPPENTETTYQKYTNVNCCLTQVKFILFQTQGN